MSDRPKDCLLFLSHHLRPGAMQAFADLKDQCGAVFDVIPIFDQTHDQFAVNQVAANAVILDSRKLEQSLPYPNKNSQHPGTLWPFNIDLPLLWFFSRRQTYRNYWLIEYDVRFSGHWLDFFSAFSENGSDLLAISVFDYAFRPDWGHWSSFLPDDVPLHRRVRATLSFYRLSNRALKRLDQAYRDGASGHYEVAIPTILKEAGYRLEDVGGDGAYVAPGNHNRFYINAPQTPGLAPGTFVLHAEDMIKDQIPNMLWNPFKG